MFSDNSYPNLMEPPNPPSSAPPMHDIVNEKQSSDFKIKNEETVEDTTRYGLLVTAR